MAIMARPTGHRNVLINGVSLCLKAPGLSSYPTTAGYCHAVGPDRLCLHRCSAYPGPLQCVELRRDDGALSPGPLGALCGASTNTVQLRHGSNQVVPRGSSTGGPSR